MEYRRFGRTDNRISVFTCGGMRFQHSWRKEGHAPIPDSAQQIVQLTINEAIAAGINHFETARAYGTSEQQLGAALTKHSRDSYFIQTKIRPNSSSYQFRQEVLESINTLGTKYIDYLCFHGINTDELAGMVTRRGGCLSAAQSLQSEGLVKHIGFSTHGELPLILKIIETDVFSFVNLHWYFINQTNWPAVMEAARHDMGVLIISPNDKGGRLYDPPEKLHRLCSPLHPMQFNDLFCLRSDAVHTLSIGARSGNDFDLHIEALDKLREKPDLVSEVADSITNEMVRVLGSNWVEQWHQGIPEFHQIQGKVNVKEILRLWTYATALDMVDWAKSRYNLMPNGSHWFPGNNAESIDETSLLTDLHNSPFMREIPSILRRTHDMLRGEPRKRLTPDE